MTTPRPFVKRNVNAPNGFFACEAAGLRWLAAAPDGARCVDVLGHDATSLTLRHLDEVPPSRSAAREFGLRLARTHAAGAPAFGAAPSGWTGPGYFGPLMNPLPMSFTPHHSWGGFYADERLLPMATRARDRLGAETMADVERVAQRCRSGDFDDDDGPARIHGDLWSGNVLWTREGAVLIDPAAHGGHRETDVAMLALFGCPHLDAILDGYQSEFALRERWRERVGLHQLYALLAHVVLFGAGYRRPTAEAAASALRA